MKPRFFHLPDTKRNRIFDSAWEEFAAQDYENASLDRIVEAAAISKGGLYEYIESKEDLYLHVLEEVYGRLYARLSAVDQPADILARFRSVSWAAVDFYLDHPRCISVIVRSSRIGDPALAARVHAVFESHFHRLFATVSEKELRFPRDRLIVLMQWLLAKTRNDFLNGLAKGADRASVRRLYMDEWEFLFSILENGIYQNERRS